MTFTMSMVGRNLLTFFFFCNLGELYGLEKFWAFRQYYKNWCSIVSHVDPFLLKKLDEFKCVDDFRLDVCCFFQFYYFIVQFIDLN